MYMYIEHGSQYRNGEVEDYKMESKCVTIVSLEGGGNCDHVFILDTYLSKIPPEMRDSICIHCNMWLVMKVLHTITGKILVHQP